MQSAVTRFVLGMGPKKAGAADLASDLHELSLSGGVRSSTSASNSAATDGDIKLCTLDGDCLRAIAAVLPIGPLPPKQLHPTSLDRRSSSMFALAKTCSQIHAALKPTLEKMRIAHVDRETAIDRLLSAIPWPRLRQLKLLSQSICTPDEAPCASCGTWLPRYALFAHDEWPAEVMAELRRVFGADDDLSDSDPSDIADTAEATDIADTSQPEAMRAIHPAVDAEPSVPNDHAAASRPASTSANGGSVRFECAHCWRMQLGLLMRPTEGFEQTWEAPIEEGTWRMVQDYSGVEVVDSPLLALEEYTGDAPQAWPLNEALACAGYVLSNVTTPSSGRDALEEPAAGTIAVDAAAPTEDEEDALPLPPNDEDQAQRPPGAARGPCILSSHLLADVIGSGHADHLLSLDLRGAGLGDVDATRLFDALVGNALHLQHLDVSTNTAITDEGVGALAAHLTTRRHVLMLPLLRWLVLGELPGVLGMAARALAHALDEHALASLEALCFHPPREAYDGPAAPVANVLAGTAEAFDALESAAAARGVEMIVGTALPPFPAAVV